jgi:hypothetical protein
VRNGDFKQSVFRQFVVVIQQRDEFAPRNLQRRIGSPCYVPVLRTVDHLYPIIRLTVLFKNFPHVRLTGAIVHKTQLPMWIMLLQDRLNALPKPFFRRVVDRHQYRDDRFPAHGAQQQFVLTTSTSTNVTAVSHLDGEFVFLGRSALTRHIQSHGMKTRRQVGNVHNNAISGIPRAWELGVNLGNVGTAHPDRGRIQLAPDPDLDFSYATLRDCPALKLNLS